LLKHLEISCALSFSLLVINGSIFAESIQGLTSPTNNQFNCVLCYLIKGKKFLDSSNLWKYLWKFCFCIRCQIAVHQECYGARNIKDFTSWVCRTCETPEIERECCLCPVKGMTLSTECNSWVINLYLVFQERFWQISACSLIYWVA